MRLKNNIDTILSNLAQQVSGALAILLVPAFLSAAEYGQVTSIVVFLSFLPFCDLGLSGVYNRKIPALLANGDSEDAAAWNGILIRIKLWGGIGFGVLIGGTYYWKSGDLSPAPVIAGIAAAGSATSFFISRAIAAGDFATSKNVTMLQAALRLAAIPGAAVLGVAGWCLGQLVASAGPLACRQNRRRWLEDWRAAGWSARLFRANFREALLLGLVANLWLQMLSFGRTFAAFAYPDAVTAQYGLVSAACQAIGSVVIAAFVPQTIKTYALLARSRDETAAYLQRTLLWAFPAMAAVASVLALALPPFFAHLFSAYHIPADLIVCFALNLMCYPVLVTLGSVLVGLEKTPLYLALVIGALLVAAGGAMATDAVFGYRAAAFGQLLAVSLFAGALSAVAFVLVRGRLILLAGALSMTPPVLYLLMVR
ncbi:MAG: hypothetical protein WCJ64_00245 [Rhodospirillaceae bacterium]